MRGKSRAVKTVSGGFTESCDPTLTRPAIAEADRDGRSARRHSIQGRGRRSRLRPGPGAAGERAFPIPPPVRPCGIRRRAR